MASPLELFHPLIRQWFEEKVGRPTDIQSKSWPVIAAGSHVLITAPTGSGKTLTAFLWSINQFITGEYTTGKTGVLYISPMKALNNDIRRNLTTPLKELKEYFIKTNIPFPEIQVQTRSGDSTPEERRRMFKYPPEILITTPESLNILLSSKNGRAMLTGVSVVILDEIHAIIGDKRGTHLITAVDRLVPLCGNFQRIALSATIKPLQTAADFTGGFEISGGPENPRYSKRKVTVIHSGLIKQYRIEVDFPEDAREKITDDSWWPVLAGEFKKIIAKNKSTLLFANSRRTAEKVTRLINENEEEIIAYSHHGSISRELRLAVEEKLKNGELKAIVATNSLELGIDIGDLDEVVLIQTPRSLSSAVQRIGRSGHKVGEISAGKLFPTHGHDFLEAAVISEGITARDTEPVVPVDCPLDVLAQVILSMTGVEEWDITGLYNFLRTSYPYRNLSGKQYELVLEMLAGRYADSRVRELRPRVSIDRMENKIKAKEGTLYLIYTSGGTIPDRGYFDMRVQDTKAKIGELDEEFVWERNTGDTFALGAQVWRILKITSSDVEVAQVKTNPGIIPFWRAEEMNRDFYYSEKIGIFLEKAEETLSDPYSFKNELKRNYSFQETAAEELANFLLRQKSVTGQALPHRHHILVEHFEDPSNRSDRKQVIIHTLWGGKINRPFALALSAAWEEKFLYPLETMVNNDSIILILPLEFEPFGLFSMVTPENIDGLLRQKLEKTGFFGAKFRENAGRALLLPKADFKKRLPLWLNRLRAKKLMELVMKYQDFPILIETWRTCIHDEFDIENLNMLLDEVRSGKITVSECFTNVPSPFCDSLIWKEINTFMYEDDTPASGNRSNLSDELMREIIYSSQLRPKIPVYLIKTLEDKLKRTAPGYAPASPDDLLDWVKERILIPQNEWVELLNSIEKNSNIEIEDILSQLTEKIILLNVSGAAFPLVCAVESIPLILSGYDISLENLSISPIINTDSTSIINKIVSKLKSYLEKSEPRVSGEEKLQEYTAILAQWLSYYGPVELKKAETLLGLPGILFNDAVQTLAESQAIVIDRISEGGTEIEICDRENLERLLRMARIERQPIFQALEPEYLQLFLAAYQGLTDSAVSLEGLQERLERLFGFPAAAEAWEESIFPARLRPYYKAWLDSLMQSSGLCWFGCGDKKLSFSFSGELGLYIEKRPPKTGKEANSEVMNILPGLRGKFSLFDIAAFTGMSTQKTAEKLWKLAWSGEITSDTFEVIRQGILSRFTPSEIEKNDLPGRVRVSGRRSGLNRWAASRPLSGGWYQPDFGEINSDLIEEEEIIKDRVRQLFLRYGILFREITANELPLLQWGKVFRTLRLMELSGEIVSGYFFRGIPGLQFASFEAYRFLQNKLPEDSVYWMSAIDPASLCGIKLDALRGRFPRRIGSNHIAYHGKEIVLISQKNGENLNIKVPPGHPGLPDYLEFFKVLLTREFNPLNSITVETINGKPALESEYKAGLKAFGFTGGYKRLELWKKY